MNKKSKSTETIEKTGDLVWVLFVFTMIAMLFSLIWGEIVDIIVKNDPNIKQTTQISPNLEKVWRFKEIKRKDGTIDWIPVLVDEEDFKKG